MNQNIPGVKDLNISPVHHWNIVLYICLNLPCLHSEEKDRLETWWFKHHFQPIAPKSFLPSSSPPSPHQLSNPPLLSPLLLLGSVGSDWKPMRQLIGGKIEIYLLCFKFTHQLSPLPRGPRLAQQYGRSKDCQRSCSVLHDGALHAPFLTNTPCPPPSLSLPFPLFQGHGFGTGPPAGGLNWNALIFRLLETSLFLSFLLFSFCQVACRVQAITECMS